MGCKIYILFTIILPLVKCNFNLPIIGRCPDLQGPPNFNTERFAGPWIVSKRSVLYTDFDCETQVFMTDISNNYRCFKIFSNTLTEFTRTFTAQTINQGRGKFAFLRSFIGDNIYMKGIFVILATNYTSYAIIYQCSDFLGFRFSTIYVLIRDTTPQPQLDNIVRQILQQNNLTTTLLGNNLEDNCKFT